MKTALAWSLIACVGAPLSTAHASTQSLWPTRADREICDPIFAQLDAHAAVEHDEDLVGIGVAMPHELALDLHELELIVVHPGDDLGRPVVAEAPQLVPEVDGLMAHAPGLTGRGGPPA